MGIFIIYIIESIKSNLTQSWYWIWDLHWIPFPYLVLALTDYRCTLDWLEGYRVIITWK